MTAKKAEPRPKLTIPIRGSMAKRREPIKKLDGIEPLRVRMKVSHRG